MPLLAGIGLAARSAAKEASDRSRSGLPPAVTSSWAACSMPTPSRGMPSRPEDEGVDLDLQMDREMVRRSLAAAARFERVTPAYDEDPREWFK